MTLIIAEVGSNYRNFDEAKDSIAIAKNCGADAVKFQLFNNIELYGQEQPNKWWQLDPEWIPKLAEKAKACEIEFMCTAFSPAGVELVDNYVSRHKIAGSDLTYPHLLSAVKETGKPILLSTGGHGRGDVRRAIDYLKDGTVNEDVKKRITVLYCSSEYPSTEHNPMIIPLLRNELGVDVGFSDHSLDVFASVFAAKLAGATVIEKHFKLRDMETPDSGHSLDPDKFAYMVTLIRNSEAHIKMPTPGEKPMVLRHNRRLIATVDIKPGDKLTYGENFGIYRSLKDDTHGANGFDWLGYHGKEAVKSISIGDSIGPGDI